MAPHLMALSTNPSGALAIKAHSCMLSLPSHSHLPLPQIKPPVLFTASEHFWFVVKIPNIYHISTTIPSTTGCEGTNNGSWIILFMESSDSSSHVDDIPEQPRPDCVNQSGNTRY